jgi:hypothetical protein
MKPSRAVATVAALLLTIAAAAPALAQTTGDCVVGGHPAEVVYCLVLCKRTKTCMGAKKTYVWVLPAASARRSTSIAAFVVTHAMVLGSRPQPSPGHNDAARAATNLCRMNRVPLMPAGEISYTLHFTQLFAVGMRAQNYPFVATPSQNNQRPAELPLTAGARVGLDASR